MTSIQYVHLFYINTYILLLFYILYNLYFPILYNGLITFFVPIFIANSQFGTVVFKKFNLVPKFFKMYSKWSFLLNITKQR